MLQGSKLDEELKTNVMLQVQLWICTSNHQVLPIFKQSLVLGFRFRICLSPSGAPRKVYVAPSEM
jgi:hypothetical protein